VPPSSGPVGYSPGDAPVHYYRDLVVFITLQYLDEIRQGTASVDMSV
jgi:hypothetical protein